MYICIMQTGIYQIKSIITGRIYIGSAVNIKIRWSRHRYDLLRNKHHSMFLQRHYNKHGLKDLEFSILEECIKESLLIREQYYLNTLTCKFNNAKIAGSCIGVIRSQAYKNKLSTLTKGVKNPTYGMERTKEWRDNISKANKGQKAWNKGKTNIYSEEILDKIKKSALNREKIKCEYCNKEIIPQNYSRWHGQKCDYKNISLENKKCPNCSIVKNKNLFSKNKTQLDGYARMCKKCLADRYKLSKIKKFDRQQW